MALTSTLFTGLSGLDVNQTRLNVVGNNIANVNTVAFKSSRALFKPQFYVTDAGGSSPSGAFGGTNPSQRGLGATVATIERDFATGSIEPTGKDTNLALDGAGFFIVRGSDTNYTRDGSFSLNGENNLVTSAGDYVQGYGVDADGNVADGKLENLHIGLGSKVSAKATGNVKLEGNLNAAGETASGATILLSQSLTTAAGTAPVGTTLLTDLRSGGATPFTAADTIKLAGQKGGRSLPEADFTVTATTTLDDLSTFFNQKLGIDTTVPDDGNAATPAAGATLDPDPLDPNSVRLAIIGNLGGDNSLEITGSAFNNQSGVAPLKFAEGPTSTGIKSNPTGESVHTTFVGYDSLGNEVAVDATAVLEKKDVTGTTWRFFANSPDTQAPSIALSTGTLSFGTDGHLLSVQGDTIDIDRTNTGAASPLSMKLDFSGLTALTTRDSDLVMTAQDGAPTGTLNGYTIGSDGIITGSYSNGVNKTLGQVAIAKFDNPQGLVDNGGNLFSAGPSSGVPVVTKPLSLGTGAVRAGALELSNVDLSKEFINLIIASTGFSASSRVITTSDQLLTDLINSSR